MLRLVSRPHVVNAMKFIRKRRCLCHASVSKERLEEVAIGAAKQGAQVVNDALELPRKISRKEGTDIVTETDTNAEAAIMSYIRGQFPDHGILGEETGLSGSLSSGYLWIIDPLDGTVNFSSRHPSFNVSVGLMENGSPVAGCIIEFVGGPGAWLTRQYSAHKGGGSYCQGKRIEASRTDEMRDAVIASELSSNHSLDPYLQELLLHYNRESRGIRMCGAAAANMCHVAEGIVDGYFQYNLKPWDSTAGVVIAEEAGCVVSTCDGSEYSPFDRSLLIAPPALHKLMLEKLKPVMEKMKKDPSVDLSRKTL
jgi:myo-inositol-1(or 4)-monophosphatase